MDLLTKLGRRFFLIIIAFLIVITLFMPMVKIKISDDKYIKQTGLDIIKSVFDDDVLSLEMEDEFLGEKTTGSETLGFLYNYEKTNVETTVFMLSYFVILVTGLVLLVFSFFRLLFGSNLPGFHFFIAILNVIASILFLIISYYLVHIENNQAIFGYFAESKIAFGSWCVLIFSLFYFFGYAFSIKQIEYVD